MSTATIKYEGKTLVVEFDYQPETKPTLSDSGTYEDADVIKIMIDYEDRTDDYCNDQLTEIESIILNLRYD